MRSRRRVAALLAAVLLVGGMMLVTAAPTSHDAPAFVANPVDHVNTLIGTGNGGRNVGEINNFPGASVPFGMVQYSPDTVDDYAGYAHANGQATGFSMTHASVGCAAFGDISMLPTTTPIGSGPWAVSEEVAHNNTEVGVPGYYTVRFPATGVTAELTAATRTGVGRFRYPGNGQPALFRVRSGSLAGNSAPDRRPAAGSAARTTSTRCTSR
jgi:putative alpha-1,2-mannosidase